MSKEYLSITVKEKVERNIIIQIGDEGISEEDANKLLKLSEDEETEFEVHSEGYSLIDSYLPFDISDSFGFYDVEIKKEDE